MKEYCCLTILTAGIIVDGRIGSIAENDAIAFTFDGFAALQHILKKIALHRLQRSNLDEKQV